MVKIFYCILLSHVLLISTYAQDAAIDVKTKKIHISFIKEFKEAFLESTAETLLPYFSKQCDNTCDVSGLGLKKYIQTQLLDDKDVIAAFEKDNIKYFPIHKNEFYIAISSYWRQDGERKKYYGIFKFYFTEEKNQKYKIVKMACANEE